MSAERATATVLIGAITMVTHAGCSSQASPTIAPPGTCELAYGAAGSADPLDRHHEERLACKFTTGSRTSETVAPSLPVLPIEHVVTLTLENRSFDHMLSDLTTAGFDGVNVAPAGVTNPDGSRGQNVSRSLASSFCIDSSIGHEWGDVHLQLNHGRLDGFVAASNPQAMSFYSKEDLPVLYGIAGQFAISDHHFSSVPGPTWPNRLFLLAATSCGYAEGGNTNIDIIVRCGLKAPNLTQSMDAIGARYAFYNEGGPASVEAAFGVSPVLPRSIARFVSDAASGSLPQVSFVAGSAGQLSTEDDDHPPANVLLGESFLYTIVHAVGTSPKWSKTVLFVTFDEHGGFYDHVLPPHACDPSPDALRDYQFDQYGFRVPLVVVSPYARHHYVSHFDTDHTSITRFVEHWLGLGALTKRDANAWPMLDMFDFTAPVADAPTVTPPRASTTTVTCTR